MEISQTRQRQLGVVLTYIQMALSILFNLVTTPIILKILGQSEYGLYNLTSSIISYLSLLTLGFGASYIRFYSRYKSQNDEEGVQRLNGLYMIVFCIMGLVALVLGLVLSFNSSIMFNDTYSAQDLHTAKILMLLLTFNMAISFPMSVYTSIISSQERFIFQKIVNIGKTVISPALSIVVIFFGFGSIGMVLVTTIISLVIDFCNIYYCKKKLKAKFKFGKIDKPLLKEIAIFALFIAINQLIDQINTQTDKIILGKMINSSAVAIYAIAATVQSMYVNFSTAVNSVFAPKIHTIINSGEKDVDDKLTDLFIKIGRIQYFILMLIMTGFIFFGKYFINLWAGADYDVAYYLVLILMIPSTVPLIQNIGIEIQRAKNKHQFRSLVYLLVAVINVVISIILCKFYGIIGVTVGTAFANIVGCCIIMDIYYHKKLGINMIKFWKSIARASLGLIIPAITGALIMKFAKFTNILIYLAFIIIYAIIYFISIYFLGMNRSEKGIIKKVFGKIKRILFSFVFVFIRPILKFCSKHPKNRVVFISFSGNQYSDNPKAISEYLSREYPNTKQIFLLRKGCYNKNEIPRNVKVINYNAWRLSFYLSSSKVVVDNDSLAYINTKKIIKSNKQLIIETWHGDRGFKKCFKVSNNETFNYKFTSEEKGKIDYFLTGSTFSEKAINAMFNFNGEFLKIGCPRNDVLFNVKKQDNDIFRERLGLNKNTKILLYAPTYRTVKYKDGEEIDFAKLISQLEAKTKKEWALIYRAHHIGNSFNVEKYIDGRKGFADMSELLPYVDMLITDYSSCAGDFALTKKPIILYCNDYKIYENQDKGLFFDIKESPYLMATNNKELEEIVKNISEKEFKKNSEDILKFYGCYETGDASKKVCEVISNFIKKHEI